MQWSMGMLGYGKQEVRGGGKSIVELNGVWQGRIQ